MPPKEVDSEYHRLDSEYHPYNRHVLGVDFKTKGTLFKYQLLKRSREILGLFHISQKVALCLHIKTNNSAQFCQVKHRKTIR